MGPMRQLIPFSPFDSSMGDANMLVMAKSGAVATVDSSFESTVGSSTRKSPRLEKLQQWLFTSWRNCFC